MCIQVGLTVIVHIRDILESKHFAWIEFKWTWTISTSATQGQAEQKSTTSMNTDNRQQNTAQDPNTGFGVPALFSAFLPLTHSLHLIS